MNVLIISGSRNPNGQTAKAIDAFRRGVKSAGGDYEHVFLPTLKIERCRQCNDDGWGLCRDAGKIVAAVKRII